MRLVVRPDMGVCRWCLTDVKWVQTVFAKPMPFENKSRPRVLVGDDGWVHAWRLGVLTMYPVTDFEPSELWGVRWVWVRHLCSPYLVAHGLARERSGSDIRYRAIMQRELDEILRRREREKRR